MKDFSSRRALYSSSSFSRERKFRSRLRGGNKKYPSRLFKSPQGVRWVILGFMIFVILAFLFKNYQTPEFKSPLFVKTPFFTTSTDTTEPEIIPPISIAPLMALSSPDDFVNTVNSQLVDLQGTYGWYVQSLSDGKSYGVNIDREFTAASVNKVPIMVSFLLNVEKGKNKLDAVYKLNSDHIESGSGSLQSKKIGSRYTYKELLRLSGKQSDNTAVNALTAQVGGANIQKYLNSLDLKITMETNKATPKAMGTFFAALYHDEIFKKTETKDLLFGYLTDSIYEDRIPKGVPEGTKVVHKIGNQIQTWNDCGIVFSQEPYVLCILTDGIAQAEAEIALPKISQLVWDYQTKAN